MKAIATVLMVCLAGIASAQETTRNIENYTSLIISRGVDVKLVKSSAQEARIKTNGIDPEDVVIENRGDELVIKVASKSLWIEMQDNHWWARVELPYKSINNIEVSTGAKLISEELFTGDLLDVQVSMGGEIELEVKLNELIIDSSMGAIAEFKGSTIKAELSASMGAEIDLDETAAEAVYAKSSMGSEIKVNATKVFDGRANMGGEIKVYGNPDKFYESTSMGGEIRSQK